MAATVDQLKNLAQSHRRRILEMIARAGKGHIGGAFSCIDVMTTLFHGGALRVDAARPDWDARDWFILSKGHSCTALYVTLSSLGFFPDSELDIYGQPGSLLGGHPHADVPGVEVDSGSLGHGLGLGAGLALAAKMDETDRMAVVLLGDGELCEGSNWEAAMFAAKQKLGNLTAVVDANTLCATDPLDQCVQLEPLAAKFAAFGWEAVEVDGHDFAALSACFSGLRERSADAPPLAVVAHTVKGKGVSFMEGQVGWHHKVPKGEQLELARVELALREGES